MFTDWASVPLVCDKRTTAKVLGMSPRQVDRLLADGTMQPAPMPRLGRKHRWAKKALQQYVEGGYRQFQQRRSA